MFQVFLKKLPAHIYATYKRFMQHSLGMELEGRYFYRRVTFFTFTCQLSDFTKLLQIAFFLVLKFLAPIYSKGALECV